VLDTDTVEEKDPRVKTTTTNHHSVTLDHIRDIENKSINIINQLQQSLFSPDQQKVLRLRFSMSEAADMVGRSTQAIREAEKKALREAEESGTTPLFPIPEKGKNNRRLGYTLEQVNQMRAHFGTLPYRGPDDEPIIMAVANFKGGVSKTTTSCHIAQAFALKGYRVCFIDTDPQGSATALFGKNPDLNVHENETLVPYMRGDRDSLHYAVQPTYFDGVSLIPANLHLYSAEQELVAFIHENTAAFDRLLMGINSIKDDFDLIVIDPPPALGMLSLSALRAANALLVPVPPSTVDFASTAHFFTMLSEEIEVLQNHGFEVSYKFLKVVATKVHENKSAHEAVLDMMRNLYGSTMLDGVLKDSAEIDNASARLMTVYELEGPITSRDTHNRCKAYLNAVTNEIELLIRKTWPSHREALRKEGLI